MINLELTFDDGSILFPRKRPRLPRRWNSQTAPILISLSSLWVHAWTAAGEHGIGAPPPPSGGASMPSGVGGAAKPAAAARPQSELQICLIDEWILLCR